MRRRRCGCTCFVEVEGGDGGKAARAFGCRSCKERENVRLLEGSEVESWCVGCGRHRGETMVLCPLLGVEESKMRCVVHERIDFILTTASPNRKDENRQRVQSLHSDALARSQQRSAV